MYTESLYQYLKEKNAIDDDFLDTIRYTLESKVYYYGNHFRFANDQQKTGNAKFKALLKKVYVYLKYFGNNSEITSNGTILSNSYFTVDSKLKVLGYNVVQPPWAIRRSQNKLFGDLGFYNKVAAFQNKLIESPYADLLTSDFLQSFNDFRNSLKEIIEKNAVKALIVPNDLAFFENLSIKIFRDLELPSFVFLHGLPGRYNSIDDNRSDYLLVWGEAIKEQYVKSGVKADKIFVTGHPQYNDFDFKRPLSSGTDNILVLARTGPGTPDSSGVKLFDRSDQIVYLLRIQNALKKLGVENVRLRFHPSANPDWHYQFLDRQFFFHDSDPLPLSLQKSSLVIGPTSTVLLEALYYGVNYIVFETGSCDPINKSTEHVPPFDGSDQRIIVCFNEADLEAAVRSKSVVDTSVFSDYVKTPFDIAFIKDLI